ncbi:MAG: hypothetical protein ACOC6B_07110 [Thermodesulfobacteriota bacterium]
MPTYHFNCEICGRPTKAWRSEDANPPRFCSKECRNKGMAGVAVKPIKWIITPEIHELIKQVYKTSSGNGEVKALAKRLRYPRWKISRYALSQGWVARQKKEKEWCEEELAVLERNAHLSLPRIQARLKAHGYHRTEQGISLKRKRMRLLTSLDGQSATSLAECLGVDTHVITKAIHSGRLKAKKRETARTKKQGGDIYFIRDKHVRDYIIDNLHEIDIRKVDKWWFVDILAGGEYGLGMRGHPLAIHRKKPSTLSNNR